MLKYLPAGDVMIHCGVFTHKGAEDEVHDFITGDHDLCLWVAEGIMDVVISCLYYVLELFDFLKSFHFSSIRQFYLAEENLVRPHPYMFCAVQGLIYNHILQRLGVLAKADELVFATLEVLKVTRFC